MSEKFQICSTFSGDFCHIKATEGGRGGVGREEWGRRGREEKKREEGEEKGKGEEERKRESSNNLPSGVGEGVGIYLKGYSKGKGKAHRRVLSLGNNLYGNLKKLPRYPESQSLLPCDKDAYIISKSPFSFKIL